MINSKVTKGAPAVATEEKLFKLLESMDWKLWEIMNMLKDNLPEKEKTPVTKTTKAKKTDE
jgi:hypothetical protein